MNIRYKKIPAVLLATAIMLFSVLTFSPMPVYAAITSIDVGAVTGANPATNLSGTGWAWDSATSTLTLSSGYTGEQIAITSSATDTATINVTGNVSIGSSIAPVSGEGITSDGNLVITGTGTLEIYTDDRDGIYSQDGSILISGATLVIDAYWAGISAENGNVTIDNNANIKIDAGAGIYADYLATIKSGNIEIDSSGDGIRGNDVIISGGICNIITLYDDGSHISGGNGIYGPNSVTISGGTLDITSYWQGIFSNDVIISGGDIKINAHYYDNYKSALTGDEGIFGENSVTISGGKLDIEAFDDGIHTYQDIIITGGTGTIKTIGGDPDYWAVRASLNTIILGGGVFVLGWNAGDNAYNIETKIDDVVPNFKTFFDIADTNYDTPLQDIWFYSLDDPDIVSDSVARNPVPQTSDSTGFLNGVIVLIAVFGGLALLVVLRRRIVGNR